MSFSQQPAGHPQHSSPRHDGWGAVGATAQSPYDLEPVYESALSHLGRRIGGLCLGMLLSLMIVVWGAQWLSTVGDYAGPGALSVTVHTAAAVVAVVAQYISDRRGGAVGWVLSLMLVLTTALVLWTQWWN